MSGSQRLLTMRLRTQTVTLLLSSQFPHEMAAHHFGISSVCQAALFIRKQPRALIWPLFSADLLSHQHQRNSTQEKNEFNSLTLSVYCCRILRLAAKVVSVTKVFLHQHVCQCTDALWFVSFLALHWFRLDVALFFWMICGFDWNGWLYRGIYKMSIFFFLAMFLRQKSCFKNSTDFSAKSVWKNPGSAYMWINVPTREVLLSSFWLKHIRGLWVNAAGHSRV